MKPRVQIALIAAIAVVLLALVVLIFPYLSGAQRFPPIIVEIADVLSFESGAPPGPSEPRYSLEFEDQPLTWAVQYLNRKAPEAQITLALELNSGSVVTRRFSLSLANATLGEVLDAFCASAATNEKLSWSQEGRNIVIRSK